MAVIAKLGSHSPVGEGVRHETSAQVRSMRPRVLEPAENEFLGKKKKGKKGFMKLADHMKEK